MKTKLSLRRLWALLFYAWALLIFTTLKIGPAYAHFSSDKKMVYHQNLLTLPLEKLQELDAFISESKRLGMPRSQALSQMRKEHKEAFALLQLASSVSNTAESPNHNGASQDLPSLGIIPADFVPTVVGNFQGRPLEQAETEGYYPQLGYGETTPECGSMLDEWTKKCIVKVMAKEKPPRKSSSA